MQQVEKKRRMLMCFSVEGFAKVMRDGFHLNREGDEDKVDSLNIACISICCTDYKHDDGRVIEGTEECEEIEWGTDYHYFKNETDHILNIEFDDISPDLWHPGGLDLDTAVSTDFMYVRKSNDHDISITYALNPEGAKKIVDFIDSNLGRDFYVHCSAGVSRSQAIVRYILDTYDEYDWQIREDNPPIVPNIHVVCMLKRAKMTKDNIQYK